MIRLLALADDIEAIRKLTGKTIIGIRTVVNLPDDRQDKRKKYHATGLVTIYTDSDKDIEQMKKDKKSFGK